MAESRGGSILQTGYTRLATAGSPPGHRLEGTALPAAEVAGCGFRAGVDVQLLVDVPDVDPDGFEVGVQAGGDFLVGVTLGGQFEDFPFALGQLRFILKVCSWYDN